MEEETPVLDEQGLYGFYHKVLQGTTCHVLDKLPCADCPYDGQTNCSTLLMSDLAWLLNAMEPVIFKVDKEYPQPMLIQKKEDTNG